MRIKPTIAAVVGPGSETRWGQVLQQPTAYGVIEVAVSDGVARVRGVMILSRLGKLLSDPPLSLRALEDIADEVVNEEVVSLVLLVPVGKVLYLVLRGGGRAYLKRGKELALLLDKSGSLSGEVREGDTLLLASQGLTTTLSTGELAIIFDHLSPVDVAEKLTLLLHEQRGVEAGAALIFQVASFVGFEEEDNEPTMAVAQPPPPISQRSESPRHFLSVVSQSRIGLRLRRILGGRGTLLFKRWSALLRERPGRKITVMVAVFLLSLFVVSVLLGVQRQATLTRSREVAEAMAAAQHAFDEGMALLPLNSVKGREKLAAAKATLEPLVDAISPRSREWKEVRALHQQIADSLTLAMQAYRVELELFYDAGLLKSGAQVSALALAEESLVLLDERNRTIFHLLIPAKRGEVVAGGEQYQGARLVALHGDRVYTLVSGGIHLARLSDKKTVPTLVPKSSEWGTIGALVAYGGNLYLLDTSRSRIWKYVATEKGFSELREYLNPDTLPDFSQATNMAIDGSVWAGTRIGKVLKFTLGKEATFLPQGVEPALGQYLEIYTSDATKNLYVLDRDNRRVVVLDKDGLYLAQYIWEQDLQPEELVVSESEKKILLLADGKLFSIVLK